MIKYDKILTISVAAYNLEKYIEQNLLSFVESDARDKVEVLVIDDESKDNTINIVEKYQKLYPNVIKLIKQKNAGPGSTVNQGIKHATGKYFRMVDGDDWVNSKNLTKLVEILEKTDVDMVITNHDLYYEDTKKVMRTHKIDIESNKVLNFDNVYENLAISMHDTTFKTSIFKGNNIKIDNGFYTDNEYLLFPIIYTTTLLYLDMTLYIYRIGREGQSISVDVAKLERNKKMADVVRKSLIDYYKNNKAIMSEEKKQFFKNRIASLCGSRFNVILTYENKKLRKKEIKELINQLKKEDIEIYNIFKKRKKEKIVICSNYLLLGIIAKIHLRRKKKRINRIDENKKKC